MPRLSREATLGWGWGQAARVRAEGDEASDTCGLIGFEFYRRDAESAENGESKRKKAPR
jgi:hypothetical protein